MQAAAERYAVGLPLTGADQPSSGVLTCRSECWSRTKAATRSRSPLSLLLVEQVVRLADERTGNAGPVRLVAAPRTIALTRGAGRRRAIALATSRRSIRRVEASLSLVPAAVAMGV